MILPQEIEKQISEECDKLTEKLKMDNDYQRGFLQGFEDGYDSAATEWAGKAQGLLDVLDNIKKMYPGSHLATIVITALAKYKEVSK